jgi:hypothetical protein
MATRVGEITAEHDSWREPGSEEQWSDSFYFGGGDGQGLAFYSRIGRRPNESRTEGALGVWLPGQGFLLSFARAGAEDEEIACGPVAFDPVDPLVGWRLRLGGRGRLFERAEHVATARDRYREVDVAGELLFTGWGRPLTFHSGLTEGVASEHYEQPGSIEGAIEVDGRRRDLSGRGLRDHSWGVRDWQLVPYWRWFGIVVDPDTYVLVNNVGIAGGGETAGGFLMREGTIAPIEACATRSELDPELGCQRSFHARATDAKGRSTEIEGRAVEVAPLRQRRDGRLTLVNEGLTEYSWEGHRAVGLSEYLVQTDGA